MTLLAASASWYAVELPLIRWAQKKRARTA